jgi:hypothetical protein
MSFEGKGKSIYPMLHAKAGSGIGCPRPALIGVDESPAGYSLAGWSPPAIRLRFTEPGSCVKWSAPSTNLQRDSYPFVSTKGATPRHLV